MIDISLRPGTYVVAVSGGVDSMALLHLLAQKAGNPPPVADSTGEKLSAVSYQLIVAHFDHGIRNDSSEDRKLVQQVAAERGFPFEYEEGKLGHGTSEEAARAARYAFLEKVKQKYGAAAVITAHHQDDLLETVILNILRGTGRAGLVSLSNRPGVIRPFLPFSKQEIRAYAKLHHVRWREDSTNADERYARNYVRHRIVPRLGNTARQALLGIIADARITNQALDTLLKQILESQASSSELVRADFIALPHPAAKELLASWLRARGVRDFTSQTLERVAVAAKTQRPGSTIDVIHGTVIRVGKDNLALVIHER